MNIFSHYSASGSELERFPFLSELAMEGYLVENPSILKLDNEIPRIIEIEKEWRKGEKDRGRIDLLACYGDSTIAIVELKKDEVNSEAFAQLEAYFEAKDHLKSVADSFQLESKESKSFPWLGILVGNSISAELKDKLMSNNSDPNKVPVAAIVLNRYKSGNQTFTVQDVVFPKKGKDRSDYEFKGGKYKKGRLVLAMFKAYAEENFGKVSASELITLSKGITFRKPIIMDYDIAYANDNTPNSKGNCVPYYFTKPEEAIIFEDGAKLAVLNWWAIDDMPVIKKIAVSLGFSYTQVS